MPFLEGGDEGGGVLGVDDGEVSGAVQREPFADLTKVVARQGLRDVVARDPTRNATDHHHHGEDDGSGDDPHQRRGDHAQRRPDPCTSPFGYADLAAGAAGDHRLRLDLAVVHLGTVDLHLLDDFRGGVGPRERQQDDVVIRLGLVLDGCHLPPPGLGWETTERRRETLKGRGCGGPEPHELQSSCDEVGWPRRTSMSRVSRPRRSGSVRNSSEPYLIEPWTKPRFAIISPAPSPGGTRT